MAVRPGRWLDRKSRERAMRQWAEMAESVEFMAHGRIRGLADEAHALRASLNRFLMRGDRKASISRAVSGSSVLARATISISPPASAEGARICFASPRTAARTSSANAPLPSTDTPSWSTSAVRWLSRWCTAAAGMRPLATIVSNVGIDVVSTSPMVSVTFLIHISCIGSSTGTPLMVVESVSTPASV